MTRFLDVPAIRSLVASIGLEDFTVKLVHYLRTDFVRWNEFTKSPRTANYFPTGVIELMPVSDKSLYSFKFVNGHPANPLRNLPSVMAFCVLAETETGEPILLAEGTLCTAIRTAATSALAATALARPNSKVMAIIGCGAQSEFQALAFKAMLGIEEVRVYDIDPNAMDKFAANMGSYPDLRVTLSKSSANATAGADIVTLATADKHHSAVLTPRMVRPGTHINAIGGDCPGKTELHPDILQDALVFVEYEPQSRIEGDVQQMTPDFKVTELWKVLAGLEPGRQSSDEITIFDSVGFAIEDFSTMRLLNDLAKSGNLGTLIDLIAQPGNPKDLFGFMAG